MRKQGTARTDKVRVRRSIYYRVNASGKRRYMITFVDSAGRQRWKTIEGGVREAEAELEAIRGRVRRGERVAPSRVTLAEYADQWLSGQTNLRRRTRETYETHLRVHALPTLGRRKLSQIDEDAVAQLVADMRTQGASPWTIRATLTPLSVLLNRAVRKGLIGSNPVMRLERGERPSLPRKEKRILSTDEIKRLLDAAPDRYRVLLATGVFTGMRLGELIGLRWDDVDFDGGFVRVRTQVDRQGERQDPKTAQGVRDVVLMPQLAGLLKEHREVAFAHGVAKLTDPVFASLTGRPLGHRNVAQRGLARAVREAGLDDPAKPRLTMHSLRDTFASHLILDVKLDVVQVSRQLGHARPSITSDVYARLFDQARHADDIRKRMAESDFGRALDRGKNVESSGGEQRRIGGVGGGSETASLSGIDH